MSTEKPPYVLVHYIGYGSDVAKLWKDTQDTNTPDSRITTKQYKDRFEYKFNAPFPAVKFLGGAGDCPGFITVPHDGSIAYRFIISKQKNVPARVKICLNLDPAFEKIDVYQNAVRDYFEEVDDSISGYYGLTLCGTRHFPNKKAFLKTRNNILQAAIDTVSQIKQSYQPH